MEDVELESAQAAHNQDAIVNINGSIVATRDTYRARAAQAALFENP